MEAFRDIIDFLVFTIRSLIVTLNNNWLSATVLYLAILSVMVTVILFIRGDHN